MADDYQVKDAAGAPFYKAAKDIGGGRKADFAIIPGTSFADVSVPELSAAQAASSAPVLAANASRSSVKIVPPTACFLAILPDQERGVPLRGGEQNAFEGGHCPTNALYIVGLPAGAHVLIWES